MLDRYADHLGIVRRPYVGESEPLWDGHALQATNPRDGVHSAAHEVAHWVLATPDQRAQVNYGWGEDWQYANIRPDHAYLPMYPNGRDDPAGEFDASVLGFAYMVRMGLDSTPIWDLYSMRTGVPDENSVRPLDPETYASRRAVQPHVRQFVDWLAQQ